MLTKDMRVDACIAKAQPFAQPILTHLRKVVHPASPEVMETIKWGMPLFEDRGILCLMASFKQHCTFGFWKGEQLLGAQSRNADAMGDFGRIAKFADLPPTARITAMVREAMKPNELGTKRIARESSDPKPALRVPSDLAAAPRSNPPAAAHFKKFPPGQRREYIEWITEATAESTRARRLATTLEWVAQGKYRNWKYM